MSTAERKLALIIRQILSQNPKATGKLTVDLHEGRVMDRYHITKAGDLRSEAARQPAPARN